MRVYKYIRIEEFGKFSRAKSRKIAQCKGSLKNSENALHLHDFFASVEDPLVFVSNFLGKIKDLHGIWKKISFNSTFIVGWDHRHKVIMLITKLSCLPFCILLLFDNLYGISALFQLDIALHTKYVTVFPFETVNHS